MLVVFLGDEIMEGLRFQIVIKKFPPKSTLVLFMFFGENNTPGGRSEGRYITYTRS